MFFLQMSGYPGSGKSTLARQLAKRTGAVVIDHDIVKSALLQAGSALSSLDPKAVGGVAYEVDWALVDQQLAAGHSVILDSPCLYRPLLAKGQELAAKHGVSYKYIECLLGDQHERHRRLQTRTRLPSQVVEVQPAVRDIMMTMETSRMQRPDDAAIPYLVIDTARPPETYVDAAWSYIADAVCWGEAQPSDGVSWVAAGLRMRRLESGDLTAMIALMQDVVSRLPVRSWFATDSVDSLQQMLDAGAEMFGAFEGDVLRAYTVLALPKEGEAHLGRICGVPEQEWDHVRVLDASVVHESVRGRGLQRYFLALREQRAAAQGVLHVAATVHPDNLASRRNLEAAGFVHACTREMYGDYLRCCYVKRIGGE